MGELRKVAIAAAAGVAFGYAAWLALLFAQHFWLLDAGGRPLVTDFLAPYTAGTLARSGAALSAYSPQAQHAAEAIVLGHDFKGALGWPYPPQYFFVVAPLAFLSFAQAFLLWSITTATGYAATIAAITKRREAALFALAAPWSLACFMVGQNGFFSAVLLGLALLFLNRRPLPAALLICILTYKPQFGLLLPLALIAGGYWRVTILTIVLLAALLALSGAVFGFQSFPAFWHLLPATANTLVEHGGVGWGKLQSLYGFVRWLGGPSSFAWTAQGLLTLTMAGGIVWLWRSKAAYEHKAAALAAATLLATPYVFLYDLPILAVAAGFLMRLEKPDRFETGAVAGAVLAFIAAALLAAPLAWLGALALAAAAYRQLWPVNPRRNS